MRTIDTHAHIVPQDCLDLLPEPLSANIMVGNMTDVEVRLKEMDESGIEVQALSGFLALLSRNVTVARQFNDSLARVVAAHPDRFVGLALAPMAEPEKAPEELDRAVKELGMVGVGIASNINGTNLDAKELGPFYAKVQELDIPIFIHRRDIHRPRLRGQASIAVTDRIIKAGNPIEVRIRG